MLSFLHSARLQEFANDGKILANGYIQSYEFQTTTPKPLYKDANGIAVHTNPCYLDSSGSADIYLLGNYTLYLYDRFGVQIGSPIDLINGTNTYITSGGTGGFADNIILSVNTYNDVRAITNPYSVIFVQGRELNADGGEGFFYFDASSTLSDDDGIVLIPSTSFGRYIRLNVTNIDPQWFGLQYDSILDQSAYIAKAEYSASQFSKPVIFTGNVYINSNYTTSATEFIFSDSSLLTSTLSVTFTFDSAASISYMGRKTFYNSVQPIFQRGSTDYIRYSWMDADNTEGRWQKFLNASQTETTYILDEDMNISSDIIIPNNSKIIFENASRINLTPGVPYNINIPKLESPELITSAVYFPTSAAIGSINLQNQKITPKFFCGIGSAITSATSGQDFTALHASLKSGYVFIDDTYYLHAQHIIPNAVTIESNCSRFISASEVSTQDRIEYKTSGALLSATSSIEFVNVAISMLSATSIHSKTRSLFDGCVIYSPFATGYLLTDGEQELRNTRLSENITTLESNNNVYFDNVIKESEPTKRFYKNNTQFQNVYLEDELQSGDFDNILVTSSDGFVYGKHSLVLDSISANTTSFGLQYLDTSVTTQIKFDNDFVYRNGVLLNQETYYDIRSDDSPIIEVEIINTTGDRLIRPAANPSNTNHFTVIYKYYGSTGSLRVGDDTVGSQYTWNPGFNTLLPSAFIPGKTTVTGILLGGRWSLG